MKKMFFIPLALTAALSSSITAGSVSVVTSQPTPTTETQARIPEAETALIHLQKEITKTGGLTQEAINLLNEQGSLNTEGQRENDSNRRAEIGDVTCIQDSKIVVSPDPRLLGTSTANWKDAQGDLILPKIVAALHSSNGFAHVTFTQNVASVDAHSPSHTETCTIVAAKSAKLLNGKNSTGQKFLCYKEVK